jgi:2-keto-3-deoxy-L-fuconate dehydrogenase
MFSLKNKTAVITGAASGIGKAVAIVFAKQGADIHLLDLNGEALELVAGEIRALGVSATAHQVDLVSQAAVRSVFEKINKVDLLVNSAGVSHIGNAENTSEEDFDRLYFVNVKGMYNCLHEAISAMKKNKYGVIVNMASIANHVGLQDRFAYSMSKGAVSGMTLSVARDYMADGIRCNCVSPARVHTAFVDNFLAKNYPGKEAEMFEKLSRSQPIGRMARPEEVAHLILYLCSDEASFITGCDYPLDGGFLKLNN